MMSNSLRLSGRLFRLSSDLHRKYSSTTTCTKKGLVLGVYSEKGKAIEFTPSATQYNNTCDGKLAESLKLIGSEVAEGKSYVFWGLHPEFQSVAVVGLGKRNKGYDELERICQDREAVRVAAAAGCRTLQDAGIEEITLENLEDAEACAEGSTLSLFKFQEYKAKKKTPPTVCLYECDRETDSGLWEQGIIKGNAQNLARTLADTPANLLTPTIYSQRTADIFSGLDVTILSHDAQWARDQGMGAFLSVSRGSTEQPVFLELAYNGGAPEEPPCVLIGKGVTFDSGGISIKPSAGMDEMRADMGGAAAVTGALQAIAKLKLPVNVRVLIPLTENMPSGSATKPGDVVTAMNGKTICVDNTDAEGRLILADALCYSAVYKPKWILDIATLTGAMRVALGGAATGVFTTSTALYHHLETASSHTGDRVWRMPLWRHYTTLVTDYPAYDVNNVGRGKGGGGSCTAAAFLREFVPAGVAWLHLDMAGVMGPGDGMKYIGAGGGMTGRPTRTLVEFVEAAAGKETETDEGKC